MFLHEPARNLCASDGMVLVQHHDAVAALCKPSCGAEPHNTAFRRRFGIIPAPSLPCSLSSLPLNLPLSRSPSLPLSLLSPSLPLSLPLPPSPSSSPCCVWPGVVGRGWCLPPAVGVCFACLRARLRQVRSVMLVGCSAGCLLVGLWLGWALRPVWLVVFQWWAVVAVVSVAGFVGTQAEDALGGQCVCGLLHSDPPALRGVFAHSSLSPSTRRRAPGVRKGGSGAYVIIRSHMPSAIGAKVPVAFGEWRRTPP